MRRLYRARAGHALPGLVPHIRDIPHIDDGALEARAASLCV